MYYYLYKNPIFICPLLFIQHRRACLYQHLHTLSEFLKIFICQTYNQVIYIIIRKIKYKINLNFL